VPSPTATSTPLPPTPTPTVTLCPTPTQIYLGEWKITHYPIAVEWDSQFPTVNPDTGESDYLPVSGLDHTKKYRRQFIYSPAGIYTQGTGLAEDRQTYITIDWTTNDQEYGKGWIDNTNPALWYFTYGIGGNFKNPVAWKSVAMSQNEGQLIFGNKVKIDGYSETFEVTDTGTFPDTSHLDVFIGEMFYAEALKYGTVYRSVWKVVGE
jgi:3D (Asp-Asp-Asp) domain-containing protein